MRDLLHFTTDLRCALLCQSQKFAHSFSISSCWSRPEYHAAGMLSMPYSAPAKPPATAATVSVSRPKLTAFSTHGLVAFRVQKAPNCRFQSGDHITEAGNFLLRQGGKAGFCQPTVVDKLRPLAGERFRFGKAVFHSFLIRLFQQLHQDRIVYAAANQRAGMGMGQFGHILTQRQRLYK